MEEKEKILQLQGHLVNMAAQMEQMKDDIKELLKENQIYHNQISVLTQHLINPDRNEKIYEYLANLVSQMEEKQEQLDRLEKSVKNLNRTQFKTNTLGQSKEQQTQEAISILNEILKKREKVEEGHRIIEQEQIKKLKKQAKSELAADFIPILDGIEMALEHGENLQKKGKKRVHIEYQASFLNKLLNQVLTHSESEKQELVLKFNSETEEAIKSWLEGLKIVRERFLSLLEIQEILQVEPIGKPFNPHFHIATKTEVKEEVPENTVIGVVRKGYVQNDRILRYAEVVVAKHPKIEEVDENIQEKETLF